MAPHEVGANNGDDGFSPRLDSPGATIPASAPGAFPATLESNVKRRVRHSRQASLDNQYEARNEPQHQYPPFPTQKKRKSVTISQKHLPDERKSLETIDTRLLSPADPPAEAAATVGPEASRAGDGSEERDGQSPGEGGVPHAKDRPRRAGPRRASPRRLMGPNQGFSPQAPPHVMDFMVGEAEEPPYYGSVPPNGYPGGPPVHDHGRSPGRGSLMGATGHEEHFDGHFPPTPGPGLLPPFDARFGSPEVPFRPDSTGFFPHPQGPPPFPPELPVPQALLALPPPERPLGGYDLLAAKLSGNIAGPKLAPIYRRFESLHHRLLLHLQDELAQLEAQLNELDTQDAHHRMFAGNGPPGSRRGSRQAPQDMNWPRNECINQIAQKLYQYNQALASYKETRSLGEPSVAEVYGYRSYLENCVPEVLDECNFLDAPDLVCLARHKPAPPREPAESPLGALPRSVGPAGVRPISPPSEVGSHRSSGRRSYVRTTPAPQAQIAAAGHPPPPPRAKAQAQPQGQPETRDAVPLNHLVLALAAAVLAPILSFSIIHGFAARLTVVMLIALGGGAGVFLSGYSDGLVADRDPKDIAVCLGVYGAAMAIIAGTVS